MARKNSALRWLKSTSNRTFVVWPLALVAAEWALQGGPPRINAWALPLLAWGYLQYRWVGVLRTRLGGGGPGLANPPERIVESGPYRWVRNPMYLGHLVFLAGLAVVLRSWLGLALFVVHAVWFESRVRTDERGLLERFGEPYREYCGRVKRWIPGVY